MLARLLALLLIVGGATAVAWRAVPAEPLIAVPEFSGPMAELAETVPLGLSEPEPAQEPVTERERLYASACSYLGVPYRFGAKGPDEIDCSGFTRAAYIDIGIELPHGSFNQAEFERPLTDASVLVPGDLLFYRWEGRVDVSHVTMYAGDGWVIGTGGGSQPPYVSRYPLIDDLSDDGRVITYRHIVLSDEES